MLKGKINSVMRQWTLICNTCSRASTPLQFTDSMLAIARLSWSIPCWLKC